MSVWDVGCGSGEMTEVIADLVGPTGHVYALDISQNQIDTTKERLSTAGYKNVTYFVGDILNFNNNNFKKADIVHSRLLLMHVKEPKEVIKKMISLLKSNGVLSLQESSMNSLNDNFKNQAIAQYYKLIQNYGEINKLSYNIGIQLPKLCEELKVFSKIEHYTTKFDLSSQNGKSLILSRFDEIQNKLIESQLSTAEEMSYLKSEIIDYYENNNLSNCSIYTEQTHLIGDL